MQGAISTRAMEADSARAAMVVRSNRELAEENRRIRTLRMIVDAAAVVLRHRPLSRGEAEELVRAVRAQVLELFPGKEATFDLIYGARFRRLIEERFGAG